METESPSWFVDEEANAMEANDFRLTSPIAVFETENWGVNRNVWRFAPANVGLLNAATKAGLVIQTRAIT